MKKNPEHIVITGASSGIGRALAEGYAGPGARLSLCGRDSQRLEDVARVCALKGAVVHQNILDITDKAAVRRWLIECDARQRVDIVIANAGISGSKTGMFAGETEEQEREIFDVNLTGVLNSVHPLLPRMIDERCGHIVIMSSLAGYRGWPWAPAYCASKAAVRVYGESLRGTLAQKGVKVSVICPGFVKSRMTEKNSFPMPLLMDAGRASELIIKGIEKNKARISFPLLVVFFVWLFSILPDNLVQRVVVLGSKSRKH